MNPQNPEPKIAIYLRFSPKMLRYIVVKASKIDPLENNFQPFSGQFMWVNQQIFQAQTVPKSQGQLHFYAKCFQKCQNFKKSHSVLIFGSFCRIL